LKRTLSILLILLLVFNSAGFVLVYYELLYIFQLDAKTSLSSYVPDELLTEIIIHKDGLNREIEWIDDGEIKVNGKMFDILRRENQGDDTVLVCVSDDKENKLQEIFEESFNKSFNPSASKTPAVNILKILIKNALAPETKNYFYISGKQRPLTFVLEEILDPFLDVLTPPPKYFS
jgi:hypothetical protein